MTQLAINFDINRDLCVRKSRGNPESKAAHDRVIHSKLETYERILAFIDLKGRATVHQIAEGLGFGKEIHRVSGRLSELKMMKPPKLRKVRNTERSGAVRTSEMKLS